MTDVLEQSSLPERVAEAIATVTGAGPVSLHEPRFAGNEWAYVKDCIDSTFVSSVGRFVDRFELDLADYVGAKYAVAVVNGTAALYVALMLAGVRDDDEVLVPALTFVATANAVSYCGAVPHFVDSDERTLGVSVGPLRAYLDRTTESRGGVCVNRITGRAIRALVPMHTFGHPADLDGLLSITHDFNLVLIEDAAESLGSFYCGRHTGTVGRMGALSFNGNKTITTGGGGAVLTNDPVLARRAKHLTTTAKIPHRWGFTHDEVGFNFRMPNINAALGCAQLEQLPGMLEAKRRLYGLYRSAFAGISEACIFAEPDNSVSNYWLQTLVLDESVADQQEAILQLTNDRGLMTRPVWGLMHRQKPFRNCPHAELPVAESIERRAINLPSSAFLA